MTSLTDGNSLAAGTKAPREMNFKDSPNMEKIRKEYIENYKQISEKDEDESLPGSPMRKGQAQIVKFPSDSRYKTPTPAAEEELQEINSAGRLTARIKQD
jgi:hypothetical protein